MVAYDPVTQPEVIRSLHELLDLAEFQRSPVLSRLLEHLVREALEGRSDRLKAYSIAIDALGKSEDFDPVVDASVRVTVGRLRRLLLAANKTEQMKSAPVQISIPKGTYIPTFTRNSNYEVATKLPREANRLTITSFLAACSLIIAVVLTLNEIVGFWSAERFTEHRLEVESSQEQDPNFLKCRKHADEDYEIEAGLFLPDDTIEDCIITQYQDASVTLQLVKKPSSQ